MIEYVIRIGNSLSQFANVVFWLGYSDESISGRAYREDRTWLVRFINAVFFWQENHCEQSYYNDLSYAGMILARHREKLRRRH